MMMSKKTLEINPDHPLIKNVLSRVKLIKKDERDEIAEDLASLMHDMALLNSGFAMDDPTDFSIRMQRTIRRGLNVSFDESVKT